VGFERNYPAQFDRQRPMRVLFLGQVNLRKGISVLLEAARYLADQPIVFDIVGERQVTVPDWALANPNIRWIGPVPRQDAAAFYRNADVFLFPTFSDGFGLTQLEAQAWKLPVIASRFCGEVVEDGVNGIVLPEVTPDVVAAALLRCVRAPEQLARMSMASGVAPNFTLAGLARSLSSILQ
jgi:glycosyltransferase involved in cell wall biosynthesis